MGIPLELHLIGDAPQIPAYESQHCPNPYMAINAQKLLATRTGIISIISIRTYIIQIYRNYFRYSPQSLAFHGDFSDQTEATQLFGRPLRPPSYRHNPRMSSASHTPKQQLSGTLNT